MNKYKLKTLTYIALAALIIGQFFGCVIHEINKTDQERIEEVNRDLNKQYREFTFTDDLNKKYSIKKNIRFKFLDKNTEFIEDEAVKQFVEECIKGD